MPHSESNLVDPTQIRPWQPQKRVCLVLIKWMLALLAVCLGLRFIPIINDWISGPAEPVKAIAQQLAKAVATATNKENPVIVMPAENQTCQNAQLDSSTDDYVPLYVIAYSERSHSVCLTTYVHFLSRAQPPNTVTLSENMGRNYGYPLPAPIKAVPLLNHLTTYPQQYLSLMHWRTKIRFPLAYAELLKAQTRQYSPNGNSSNILDLELRLEDMRATVAERHNAVNHALFTALSCFSILSLILAGWAWVIFLRLKQYCRSYGFTVSPRMYLQENLAAVRDRAHRYHFIQQQEAQERLRAQNVFKHSIEEARQRLQFLIEAVPDENTRVEIRSCLERSNLEEMNAVYQQYQALAGQKTHEEKLALLLESLKLYCSQEEFDGYHNEAFTLLRESGFRQARDFSVRAHDELRQRFKRSVEEAARQEEKDTRQPTGTDGE